MRQILRQRAARIWPFPSWKCPAVLALHLCFAATLLLHLTPAAGTELPASKRAAAKAQLERAEKQRTALQGKPQSERTVEEYKRVATEYRRVYLITPHAAEVPAALRAVAELYQEMGRQFEAKFFQSAIDAYQFLLHEYPTSRYREDALMTIGQIQKDNLGQLELAEKTFQEFLKLHPRSPKAQQIKEALAEIAAQREQERDRKSVV